MEGLLHYYYKNTPTDSVQEFICNFWTTFNTHQCEVVIFELAALAVASSFLVSVLLGSASAPLIAVCHPSAPKEPRV